MLPRYRQYYAVCLLTLLCGVLSCVSADNSLPKKNFTRKHDDLYVRILLSCAGDPVTIASRNGIRISDKGPDARLSDRVAGSIVIVPETAVNPILVEPVAAFIEINGRPFRGSIEVHQRNSLIYIINTVKLDEYLLSVVPGEIPANWEGEALKAQAVAARTYIYYHLIENRGRGAGLYDLDAGINAQVYRGIAVERPETSNAVMKTAGEILVYKNMPIISYFHSTCGGKTIDGKYVWHRNDLEYLRGVTCDYCRDSTKYAWETQLTLEEMKSILQKKYGPIGAINSINFKKRKAES
jgi:peptidoglycan hydrolase-like amidase